MVHGPNVEAIAGERVHQRVLAAWNAQIEARLRRQRRAVNQKQHWKRFIGRARQFAEPLAVDRKPNAGFVRPMGFAQNIVSCGAGLGRRQARTKSSAKAGAKCCANTQTGPGEQYSSGNVALSHFVSSMSTGKLS